MKPYLLLICSVFFSSGCLAIPIPNLNITVRATDENGAPVPGAQIGIGVAGGTTKSHQYVQGLSDANGIFVGEISGLYAPSFNARKDGYYEYCASIYSTVKTDGFTRSWAPSSLNVVAILKPILNPVPMYVRQMETDLPELEKDCPFDMVASDWLPPHGKGKVPHITFYGTRIYNGWDDWSATLKVRFLGETSGYLIHQEDLGSTADGSSFKLPRHAAESGYIKTWEYSRASDSQTPQDPKISWVFRTATTEDANGVNASALYGKIRGPIFFGPRGRPTLGLFFTYYLNPDGTRNLEFDPARNLLKDRKDIRDFGFPTDP